MMKNIIIGLTLVYLVNFVLAADIYNCHSKDYALIIGDGTPNKYKFNKAQLKAGDDTFSHKGFSAKMCKSLDKHFTNGKLEKRLENKEPSSTITDNDAQIAQYGADEFYKCCFAAVKLGKNNNTYGCIGVTRKEYEDLGKFKNDLKKGDGIFKNNFKVDKIYQFDCKANYLNLGLLFLLAFLL